MKKKIQISFLITYFLMVIFTATSAATYTYPVNKNKETKISSISTLASSPEFNFQSEAQVLMEPTTGKILYANNENEKLLPASVTKVMTILLTMEQIDSRKNDLSR